jgi:hypothetical protein
MSPFAFISIKALHSSGSNARSSVVFSFQLFKRIWHVFQIGMSLFTLPCMAYCALPFLWEHLINHEPFPCYFHGSGKRCMQIMSDAVLHPCMHMFQSNSEVDKTWACTRTDSWDFACTVTSFITGWVGFFSSMHVLPPFQNIRCFSFMKQMYLDIF